ncbi:hypothetical protein JHK85_030940 [Glycine max]|nr:hypothetical protein JHK85_030940 [Glycine max]KAG4993578.1 hypothetical protein JHK86_030405 [Glycine max]
MAEVAVSTVVTKLTGLLVEQAAVAAVSVSQLAGVREQVENLKNELGWMQSFLRDADAKQEGNDRVRMWVSEIRDVAFEAEELIETYVYKTTMQGSLDKVFRPFHLYKVRTRIDKILSKIKSISDRRETYGVVVMTRDDGNNSNERLRHWRQPSPYSEEEYVIELEDDMGLLFTQLLAVEPTPHVVSIVGMGGLGKTTLAKKLYNHARITNHFECKAWVYVSKEYRRRDVLQGILKDVDALTRDGMERRIPEEELVNKLRNVLSEKRYLVVLDDIWGMEVWDGLKSAFPRGKMGSKILLTTRNWDVALHVDACSNPHQLRPLTEDESFRLLCNKAFPGAKGIPLELVQLESLAKEIVVKCGGLPLAVVVVGGDVAGPSTKARRHSMHFCHDRYDSLKHNSDHSRSLLFFNREYNADIVRKLWLPLNLQQEKKLNFIFRKFKLLRVLELDGVRVVSLPSTIGNLIQLRYLGLRKTNLEEELPPSIGNLQNLQTLDLRYCCFLKKIPNIIWKMVNLRHLLLYTPFDSPDSSHLRLDTLTNLQTLPHIEAGNWIGDGGLANMINLRQLGICELSGQMVNSVLSTVQGLHNLHSLSLSLQSEEDEFPIFMQLSQCTHLQKLSLNGKIKKLPDPHEFPPNLLKLTLHNSHLRKESIAKLERLPNLKMLILGKGAYNWPELNFNAEGFPQLHILRLVLLKELEEWTVEESAMPRLENMVIDRCEKLKKIPEGLKAITSLKKLKIIGMPVEFEHKLRIKDLFEFTNTPVIESTTDILAIVSGTTLVGDACLHLWNGEHFQVLALHCTAYLLQFIVDNVHTA